MVNIDTEFDPNIFQDIANWPQLLSDKMRLALISKEPTEFQNLKGHFKPREKHGVRPELRFLTTRWFSKTIRNGESVLRSWL